ncbi:MAG: GNAT family N-acetyltransferase [Pyrinomonadaceae bacterium]|nr:GNAT family N-acetyltransferase [Pyrinomonadaceae bacterium]
MIFVNRNLTRKFERTEGLSNRAFVEARKKLQPESGAAWTEIAGALAMFDVAESPLTQTFGLGVFETVTNRHLDEIESFFRERGAAIIHEVSPLADASLIELLNERGYQPIEFTNVMFRAIESENNFGAEINPNIKTRIIAADEAKLWAQISSDGWATEMQGLADFMLEFGQISANSMSSFIAEIDDKPLATGALFINDETALFAGASTVPAGRKQGAQTALLNARLQYAVEQGCKIAMMCASPGSQSQRNGERNNFRIAYTRTKWQLK